MQKVLGHYSPVAETGANRAVLSRTEYEPYGLALNRVVDGVGYTGHVEDGHSGLIYMQQRYYDPLAGRFISVDPITVSTKTGWNFSRFTYAGSNPFGYTDPDGREIRCSEGKCSAEGTGPIIQIVVEYVQIKILQMAMKIAIVMNESGEAESASGSSEVDGDREAVDSLIDDLKGGKSPARGPEGQIGAVEGSPEQAELDWEKIKGVPGAVVKDDNNVRLPDGSNANRHNSTKPFPGGAPAGTDTIKIYRPGSNIPSYTGRYPR